MKINYLTDDPSKEYGKRLKAARTLMALREAIEEYKNVAPDALHVVHKMDENDFKQFKKDLPKMKTAEGKEAERMVEKWGKIVMPMKLIWSTIVANKYHAPWGTAFIRCEEVGWPKKNETKK